MTNFQKLKHDARRAEQRSDWQRAIDLYRRALDFGPETVDLRIYNRIGDLHMRQGETDAAVECYEQAAERYAAQGMFTSAIALCNKTLRIAPGRDSIYRRLGGLHARTGLLAEGRRNCMIFVERAVEAGRLAEAEEAVQEFVVETGDEQIRLAYADALQNHGDTMTAAGQLQVVHDARVARGSDASDLLDRIQQLNPEIRIDAATIPEQDPEHVGSFDLATLVARELESIGGVCDFDPVAPPRPALALGRSRSEDLDGTRRMLPRFRAQVSEAFPDDLAIRYDIGVEFMTIGLVDEAIEEFQFAMRETSLMEAAHARIAECFALCGSRSEFEVAPPTEHRRVEVVPAPEPDPDPEPESVEGVGAEQVDEDSDDLEGHYFRARLAQYRIRRAEDRHATDFAAHVELGAAYAEMELIQEAVRELAVAVTGPRSVASRAARALQQLGERPETLPELALHIVEVLSTVASDDLADELARTLAENWGANHALAARLEEQRKEIARAAEEMPALESMFPDVGLPDGTSDDLRELEELLAELEDGETSDEIGEALRVDDEYIQVLKVADAHCSEGQFEEAETVLYQLLDSLQESRRPREAMSVVDRLLILRPDDLVLHHQKTELALMVNDRLGLLAAYAQLGASLLRQGASRSARTVYGRMLDFDPASEEARQAIADIDREEMRLENEAASGQPAARSVRAPASEAERDEFDALLSNLGMDESLEPDGGAPEADGGVEPRQVDPIADANSHCELGLAFHQMGMWDEAAAELQSALPGLADVSEVLEALGECLHQAGRNEEAVEVLAPRIEEVGDDHAMVGALYYLAQALRAEGLDREARDMLSRVESTVPGYRDTAQLLSELSL